VLAAELRTEVVVVVPATSVASVGRMLAAAGDGVRNTTGAGVGTIKPFVTRAGFVVSPGSVIEVAALTLVTGWARLGTTSGDGVGANWRWVGFSLEFDVPVVVVVVVTLVAVALEGDVAGSGEVA
jgi:hypothetical protein